MKPTCWLALPLTTAALALLSAGLTAAADPPAPGGTVSADPYQQIRSYDFQDRRAESAIYQQIDAALGNPAAVAEIERKLDAVLEDSQSTLAARESVGRMLWEIGTAQSVPVLSRMLGDEKLSDVARYALERDSAPEAGRALRAALGTTHGVVLVGVINSVGDRRDPEAVGSLRRLARDQDPLIAGAAIKALGKIGTRPSLAALRALNPPTLQVEQAILACGEQMMSQRQGRDALTVYRQILDGKENPEPVRVAAAHELMAADPGRSLPVALELLQGGDPEMQAVAVRFVRELPPAADLTPLVSGLQGLQPASEELLIGALADRGDSAALPALLHAASSPNSDVQMAAIRGLGSVEGNAAAVDLLTNAITNAGYSGDLRSAARDSLGTMRGEQVDRAIIAEIPKGSPDVRSELIDALRRRATRGVTPMLFEIAQRPGASEEGAAVNALMTLGTASDYPAAVKLLLAAQTDGQRQDAETLVLALGKQVGSEQDRTAALAAGIPGSSAATRGAIYRVLAASGGATGLDALRTGVKDPDPAIQDAAIRALASSPDPAAEPELLSIARNDDTPVHKVLALRGYLRLVDANAGKNGPADQALAQYEAAIPLATDAQDKRSILSGLGRVPLPGALKDASAMLDDPEVQSEAGLAVIGIAKGTAAADPAGARAALTRVTTTVKDPAIVNQANDALKAMG